MFEQFESFCLGFAAVIHTVLLLVVLERINRPLTAIWLKWSLAGATLWHISCFFHVLMRDTTGTTAAWLDVACMSTMTAGLLLLNCGILHAALRVHRTGAVAHPPTERRYSGVYIPLLFIVAITASIARSGSRDFLVATQDYHLPYMIWMAFANLTAAWLFLQNRETIGGDGTAASFLIRFAVSLVFVTILAIAYVVVGAATTWEPPLRLATSLSPLAPTLIFAWYVFRRRLLPMVFERTLAYGAILLAVFYLHQLTLAPMMRQFSEEFQFDFYIAEGLLLVALVLAYHPLRNRVREGLRYLVSGSVAEVRDATRTVSVELSRRSGDNAEAIADWFVKQLRAALKLQYAFLRIAEPFQRHCIDSIEPDTSPLMAAFTAIDDVNFPMAERWIDRSRCDNAELLTAMRDTDMIAAFPISYRNISGMLFLGTPLSSDRLSDEQLNSTSMLVDQFAATIHNRQLESARQSAERRAAQQEKLSVLGLLSGSLAHELRNPLSSIRTIATLLREDLSSNRDQVKDVDLIVSEIDRLTETTQRLLDFSQPPKSSEVGVSPDAVIERLMQILSHLARQHDVQVDQDLQLGDIKAVATDAALNDILFNLIKNAIEAVRGCEVRHIRIVTTPSRTAETEAAMAVVRISDTGPGVAVDVKDQMFEPFVTGKSDGTGLGLYLVGERIREINGRIECHSDSAGTTFEITLPVLTGGSHNNCSEAINE